MPIYPWNNELFVTAFFQKTRNFRQRSSPTQVEQVTKNVNGSSNLIYEIYLYCVYNKYVKNNWFRDSSIACGKLINLMLSYNLITISATRSILYLYPE